ncbi:hypothetical protein Lal_00037748, partial [Lupinus albus]
QVKKLVHLPRIQSTTWNIGPLLETKWVVEIARELDASREDLNGHIGSDTRRYEGSHEGYVIRESNTNEAKWSSYHIYEYEVMLSIQFIFNRKSDIIFSFITKLYQEKA